MLVTKQPVLKRFWYPIISIEALKIAPQSFTLLGQKIALWLDATGKPAAIADRCCHRSAQLSKGKVIAGNLSCPYHGWTFNASGTCVKVPQIAVEMIPKTYCVKAYHCTERYGYAWVCLADEPIANIPEFPEAGDPKLRYIPEFYEPWRCSGLRIMENSFDNAHPHFVHENTFGDAANPIPPDYDLIEETETGIRVKSVLPVLNSPLQQKNLQMAETETVRILEMTWYMPFTRKLQITYPNGLIHTIITSATPINDSTSQVIQFCWRNDTEADAKASDIIAFDRAVTLEDIAVLETTDYDTPLDLQQEQHMFTDKPGIFMRRKLAALLKAQGEEEQRGDRLLE